MRSRGHKPMFCNLSCPVSREIPCYKIIKSIMDRKAGKLISFKLRAYLERNTNFSHHNSKRMCPWPGIHSGPVTDRSGFEAIWPKSVLTQSVTTGAKTSAWFREWQHSGSVELNLCRFSSQPKLNLQSDAQGSQGGARYATAPALFRRALALKPETCSSAWAEIL